MHSLLYWIVAVVLLVIVAAVAAVWLSRRRIDPDEAGAGYSVEIRGKGDTLIYREDRRYIEIPLSSHGGWLLDPECIERWSTGDYLAGGEREKIIRRIVRHFNNQQMKIQVAGSS